ncbi:MAG: class I SAM-dependent methyltransferase [Candidatus Promineifilaceae bacterium]
MRPETAEQLRRINRRFYSRFAAEFAATRRRPQPGFARLSRALPSPCRTVLDLGCGEGCFGRYLRQLGCQFEYAGVDFAPALLAKAQADLQGTFLARDLSAAGALNGLGSFDLVLCLAALQHIPGRDRRLALLQAVRERLAPAGRVFLSCWQFTASPRQRRKILEWSAVGLARAAVEPNDHLLSWGESGQAVRYVAMIDRAELLALLQAAGLEAILDFRSDGREGDLNLYVVARRL